MTTFPHGEAGDHGLPNVRTVSAAEAGQKLVQYLGRVVGSDVPGSVFMRWIRTGQVRVDGKRAKPFDRVEEGQAVRLPPFAMEASGREPTQARPGSAGAAAAPGRADTREAGMTTGSDDDRGRGGSGSKDECHAPERAGRGTRTASGAGHASASNAQGSGLDILAETERWLVIAKPPGLPVHPGTGWSDSVQTRLDAAFAGDPFVPVLAHRLDRDTSGVLLAAKTHRALTQAHEAIRRGEAVKQYLCWVRGRWGLSAPGRSVELVDRLEKAGPAGKERMVVSDAGKLSRLAATPLVVEPDRSLLAVRLFTGRTHQIRAQLASRGHAIVGDAKYGGGRPPLYLHAWKLSLLGDEFACPPPWEGRWAAPDLPD